MLVEAEVQVDVDNMVEVVDLLVIRTNSAYPAVVLKLVLIRLGQVLLDL